MPDPGPARAGQIPQHAGVPIEQPVRMALLRKVDAVTIPVPDLDDGLRFYCDTLGHRLRWRNDAVAQAGLELPDSDTEIVLTTRFDHEPSWLVESVDTAVGVTPILPRPERA
jgi:catechol 2,3-dioxygenase-like lactoylglutathione lyase family enzyme